MYIWFPQDDIRRRLDSTGRFGEELADLGASHADDDALKRTGKLVPHRREK